MPPERPAETTKESEEMRQHVDKRFNTESDCQTTAGPALIETLVSKVADEDTRCLQPQNAELLPGPSSEEQPPRHEPAQEVSDPHDKTKSLVEQIVFCFRQSLAGEQTPVPGIIFHSCSLPIDCKVSDKVRVKICASEYIDFGVLLSNPIFENKFKIAVSNGR